MQSFVQRLKEKDDKFGLRRAFSAQMTEWYVRPPREL